MATPAAPTTAVQTRNVRTAAASGFFGTTLEYYDFLIFGTAAALFFGPVFFPDSSLGTLLALSSFAVAYFVRPLGAVLWGHLGDRFSRKNVLVAILLTMGIATFLIGCIPSYATIGPAAPVILVLLRVVQGLSVAGEQTGSALLTLEHAPDRNRAFYTSWTQNGTPLGLVLASVAFLPVTAFLSEEDMLAWGWRIPFWASAVVVVLTFVLRRRLPEPQIHRALQREGLAPRVPLAEVFRGHWRAVIRIAVASTSTVVASFVFVFGLSYATSGLGLGRTPMLVFIAVTNVVLLVTQPGFAILSDRIGRRPVFATGAVGCAAVTPLWLAALNSGNWVLIYATGFALVSVFYAMMTSVLLATFLEMFPTQVRFTGTAVSFMLGIVVTGFFPTIAQSFVQGRPDNWGPIAWLFAAVMIAVSIAVLIGRETYRVRTAELGRTGGAAGGDAPALLGVREKELPPV